MSAIDLIDSCTEIANMELGVLAAHCPHCQGYLEIRPANGRIELGYCSGGNADRFEVAQSLLVEGLEVVRAPDQQCLVLVAGDRRWLFRE